MGSGDPETTIKPLEGTLKKVYDLKAVKKVKEKKDYNGEYEAASAPLEMRAGQFALNLHTGIFHNKQHREELRLIMASIVVVNAVHFQAMNQVNYVCLCEQFKPIEEGVPVPGYIPTFKMEDGKPVECVWESHEEYIKNTEKKPQ